MLAPEGSLGFQFPSMNMWSRHVLQPSSILPNIETHPVIWHPHQDAAFTASKIPLWSYTQRQKFPIGPQLMDVCLVSCK